MPGSPRLDWTGLAEHVRAAIEDEVGPVVDTVNATTGFSPGLAARCTTAHGERVFVKSVSPEQNPISPRMYRDEAAIAAQLPEHAPVPRLRRTIDDGHHVTLIFDCIEGAPPETPWRPAQLAAVLDAVEDMATWTDPAPLADLPTAVERLAADFHGWRRLPEVDAAGVDPWCLRHLDELMAWEERFHHIAAGTALVHLDLRSDNLLIDTDGRVWFVDWPFGARGHSWMDLAGMLPSITMEGGPSPHELWSTRQLARGADSDDVIAFVVAMAGMFTHRARTPPPPGIPTLRTFQEAQGRPARAWVRDLLG